MSTATSNPGSLPGDIIEQIVDSIPSGPEIKEELEKTIKSTRTPKLTEREKRAQRGQPLLTLCLGLHGIDVYGDIDDDSTWKISEFFNHDLSIVTQYFGEHDFTSAHYPLGSTGIDLAVGLNTIFGKGGTGKTPLLELMQKSTARPSEIVYYGEPIPWYTTNLHEALIKIARAFLRKKDVFFDSTKNLVFRTPGAATTGGISGPLYAQLSDIGATFAQLGLSFVTVLNVSTKKEETLDTVQEAVRSNTNAIIFADAEKRGMYDVVIRDFIARERIAYVFSSSADKGISRVGNGSILATANDNLRSRVVDIAVDSESARETVMAQYRHLNNR